MNGFFSVLDISTRQRLTSLIWSTFFSKAAKDVISVTEIRFDLNTYRKKYSFEKKKNHYSRSTSRCERELGMPEAQLSFFLNLCVQILLILINSSNNFDSNDYDENEESNNDQEDDTPRTTYDIIPGSSANVDHVMDIVQKLPLFGNPHPKKEMLFNLLKQLVFYFPDSDAASIQYQFLFVASAIWSFGLIDFKPLSLFNSQESNAFFQVKS
jgi:hypothetical protein